MAVAVLTAAALIGSSLLLKVVSEPWARIAIAVAPVAPFALMFAAFTGLVRRLDELWVRIQFEALALAFMSVAVITVAYGQLQRIGVLAEGNFGFLWPVMALVYAACLGAAYRRYR
jgi:hypothetical protein